MSKFQELSSLIWGVADDVLRGLFKPHEYGDVILPFVSLRGPVKGQNRVRDKFHQVFLPV
jgi:hypothetical protein